MTSGDSNSHQAAELKRIVAVLKQEVSHLTVAYTTYNLLFRHSEDRMALLNRSAGGFFDLLRRIYLRDLASTICRLLDPVEMGKKQNLVIRSALPLLPDQLRIAITASLEKLEPDLEEMRNYRNWRVSHTDRSTALGTDAEQQFELRLHVIIPQIRKMMCPLEGIVYGHYSVGIPCVIGGADTLVARLELADKQLEGKQIFRDRGYIGPGMYPTTGELGS